MTTERINPEKDKAFWDWVTETYTEEQVAIIQAEGFDYSSIWQFFLANVFDKPEPLPRGRPEFEKYGISEGDWRVLEMVGGSEQKIERELKSWFQAGRITEFQVRDILTELNRRTTQTQLGIAFPEIAPEAAARGREEQITRLRETGERGVAGIPQWQLETWEDRIKAGEITREQVSSYIERREAGQEKATARKKLRRAWQVTPPQPEFARGFEQMRGGIGGTQPYQDWFAQQYPSLLSRFRANQPKLEQQFWQGLGPREVERQVELTWAERLREQTTQLKEEYATRFPFGRNARPERFAPPIQTVGF